MVKDSAVVVFDDERAVANAGVMLPALLAGRLGSRRSSIGPPISAIGLGRESGAQGVDDAVGDGAGRRLHRGLRDPALGAGRRRAGQRVAAPSTLGTFLRAFTFGHVRQLDRVLVETLKRAWAAGAGPGDERFVVDVDSFVGEGHGYAK